MGEFTIKNWREFQHYSDRNPPWIKLHFALLSSQDWVMLSDESRVLMVACMLIASRNEGRVPNNTEYIKRLCYMKRVDFKPLIDIGFLIYDSSCKQSQAEFRPEERREETEERREEGETEGFSPDDMSRMWNDKCGTDSEISKVIKLTSSRQTKCRARIKNLTLTPEKWQGVLDNMYASPFLTGKNDRKWVANFDWIIRNDENIVKVVEGSYR